MSTSRKDLDDFYKFASYYLESDEADVTMFELCELWQAENPTPEEFADTVARLKAACAALDAGEIGRPAHEIVRESCDRLGLDIDE
ncbi:MAG: hypothetical protein O2955_13115 [Planctomycetota bacterium]|nr:hypothetical protein [Planctomycetota bacterium]MDA1213450.1 hypothetical protein [Planctomycetota bacterium]